MKFPKYDKRETGFFFLFFFFSFLFFVDHLRRSQKEKIQIKTIKKTNAISETTTTKQTKKARGSLVFCCCCFLGEGFTRVRLAKVVYLRLQWLRFCLVFVIHVWADSRKKHWLGGGGRLLEFTGTIQVSSASFSSNGLAGSTFSSFCSQ